MNALRYSLIVIVLFIDVLPPQVMELENGLTSRGIYIFVSEFISHYLGSIAVPLFFVFSSYYLFFTPKAWDVKTYQKHLTKKARGLLIPYLFWNLLTLLPEYLRLWVLSRSGGETQPIHFGLDHVWTALTLPMDFPLWYVRDLMIMHFLAPLLVLAYRPGPTHDLARTPAFGSSGVSLHIPGSLSPSLEILGIIPKKQTYKRALQRRYLERTCVHACILLYTRGYIVVYTRVYSPLLGRRYSLGISRLRYRYFYLLSSAYAP